MIKQKELVPQRRFEGFQKTGAWEQYKLSDLTSLITKGTTPLDKSWVGTVNYIKAESVDPNSGNITVKANTSLKEHEGYLKRSKLIKNDILFSIVGTLGRVGIIKDKDLPANTNQQIAIIRLKDSNTNFIFNALKTDSVQSFIQSDSTIGAQPSLSLWQISDLQISLPEYKEQQKIGEFFKHLDGMIALEQRKIDKTLSLKSAYLAEMFPAEGERVPKRRFAGFTGEWDVRKLEDIADIIGGGTPSTNNYRYWNGEIDWYTPTEIGNHVYAKKSLRTITKFGLEKSSAKLLPSDKTILFTSRAGIGSMAILKKQGTTNQGFQSIVLKEDIDTYFVYSMGYKIKKYAIKNASGSTFLEISSKPLGNMTILVPSYEEQQKIGMFFKNIDDIITTHHRKLAKLKATKQAYLHEMFV